MRSLKQYIVESIHTYDLTIKVAGEVDAKWMDLFKHNLKKFDPIEITGPTTTPIQKTPYGFEGITNQPVNILKAKFRYPATEPMIRQIARLLNYDENMVRVVSTKFDDSVDHEAEQFENQVDSSPVLEKDYPSDAAAKEAAKAYGDSYLSSIKELSKDSKMKMEFSGERTKDAFDPFKPETYAKTQGNDSPMSKIKLPAKPKTGRG
jgi:hypothetical protein